MTPRPHPGPPSMSWTARPSAAAITGVPAEAPKSTPACRNRRGRLFAPSSERYVERTSGASAAGTGAARVKYCTAPAAPARTRASRSQRPARMSELRPEQAQPGPAADRRDELDHGGVGRLGQDHAAGAQDEAAPSGLRDGVLRFRLRALRGAVLQRAPLVEPAAHGARHAGLPLRQRGPGPAIVPVPEVRGHGGQPVEHEALAVAMEDGELGLRPHRLENSPVVRLAEALILFLAVEGEAGRLDGVEDALAPLAEARVHEGEDGLGDGGEGVGDRLGIFLEVVAEPVPRQLSRERERA